MDNELEKYVAFEKRITEKYPDMFKNPYGGIGVGEGWWPIVESLCSNIQHHINSRKKQNEWCVKNGKEVDPEVPQVEVAQIKEKFGGLRFYYDGGDQVIRGMVTMAEAWASASCEVCGAPGESGGKGWIKTLCPTHRAESDARYAERFKE